MPRKRNRHSAEFKAKGALEGVKGVKTAQQLGKGFQVHSTRITIGKKQLLGQVAELFKRQARGVLSAGDIQVMMPAPKHWAKNR